MSAGAAMPQVWSADDVLFADVRAAYLAPASAVVSDLLAAAAQPRQRLAGVTPFSARMRVGSILLESGDWDGAVTVAQQALQAVPQAETGQRIEASATLAAAGAEVPVADLLAEVLHAHHGRAILSTFGHVTLLALALGESGRFASALAVLDELDAALAIQSRHGRVPAALQPAIMAFVSQARQDLVGLQRSAEDAGLAPGDLPGIRALRDRQRAEDRRRAAARPPWPAPVGPDLLWWPQADYDRIVGQVPELRQVLGATWRAHTRLVQSVMAAAASRGASPTSPEPSRPLMLAQADFALFSSYLRSTGLDPRLAAVMTDYTEHAATAAASAGRPAWPPGPKDRCWCGSPQRYRACCGAAA